VLKSAVADELIPSNPVAGVERPKVKRNRGTDEPRGYRRLTDRADGGRRPWVDAAHEAIRSPSGVVFPDEADALSRRLPGCQKRVPTSRKRLR